MLKSNVCTSHALNLCKKKSEKYIQACKESTTAHWTVPLYDHTCIDRRAAAAAQGATEARGGRAPAGEASPAHAEGFVELRGLEEERGV